MRNIISFSPPNWVAVEAPNGGKLLCKNLPQHHQPRSSAVLNKLPMDTHDGVCGKQHVDNTVHTIVKSWKSLLVCFYAFSSPSLSPTWRHTSLVCPSHPIPTHHSPHPVIIGPCSDNMHLIPTSYSTTPPLELPVSLPPPLSPHPTLSPPSPISPPPHLPF